jgi:DNA polymerase III delta subunit
MNKQEIKEAISSISQLLGNSPGLLTQQLEMLKTLVPDLDEAAVQSILEKTKQPGFNPNQLEEELQRVAVSIKSATQNNP